SGMYGQGNTGLGGRPRIQTRVYSRGVLQSFRGQSGTGSSGIRGTRPYIIRVRLILGLNNRSSNQVQLVRFSKIKRVCKSGGTNLRPVGRGKLVGGGNLKRVYELCFNQRRLLQPSVTIGGRYLFRVQFVL